MKKLFGLLVLVMALALCAMGAAYADDCQHEFVLPDCTKDRSCGKCGQTISGNTEHSWEIGVLAQVPVM